MEYLHSVPIDGNYLHGIKEYFDEIGVDRYSKRQVNVFLDGSKIKIGRWRKFSIKYGLWLGDQPWPPTYEDLLKATVGIDERFRYTLITKEEFEREWKQAKYAW